MKKKILLSLLALVLALTCILCVVSCNKNENETSSSSGGDDTSSGEDNGNVNVGIIGSALPRYLRAVDFSTDSATLKFNVYSKEEATFDIRWSEKEITEKNFDKATVADFTLSGDVEKTLVVKGIAPSLTKTYWVAVKSDAGMETIRLGGNKQIYIDYETKPNAVYHGETNKSLLALFDEQRLASSLIFPSTNLGELMTNDNDVKEGKQGMRIRPIIDLEYMHYISTVNLFFGALKDNQAEVKVKWSSTPVDFMAEDDAWEGCVTLTKDDIIANSWNEIEVGTITRYIQIDFKDAHAPNEVHLYGYQKGEGDPIATTVHKLPTVGEIIGMCGFAATGGGNTTTEQLACANVLREYHNMGWSYAPSAYPGKANVNASPMAHIGGTWDSTYKTYSASILTIPCVQWVSLNVARSVDEDGLPIKEGGDFKAATYWEKFDPNVYFLYADNMYWFAARYGSNTSSDVLATLKAHTQGTTLSEHVGQGTIKWLEFGNEPNGEDALGYVPYQLAALQSAAYDGHQKTLTSTQVDRTGYHFGAVNADPNMKVAIAGLAGLQTKYMMSMTYWMKANRTDGNTAFDAFNFHTYFGYTYYMNSVDVTVGVCPEFFGVVEALSGMIEYRNKYYPEKEVWLTEFGWDTNQSYETPTACHAYNIVDMDGDGDIDEDDKFARVHQIQAEWLVRAYILFSSVGLDKATMYMCEDTSNDRVSVGKYGTCGIYGVDDKGKMYAKDSYYYISTLSSALEDYTFVREIKSGDDNVWIYEFQNSKGKTAYATWCPTMDGTHVDDFQISIDGAKATAITFVDNDMDGISSTLSVKDGKVKVDVSESVTIILVD